MCSYLLIVLRNVRRRPPKIEDIDLLHIMQTQSCKTTNEYWSAKSTL